MMARANLGQLLGNVGANATPAAPKAEPPKVAEETEPAIPGVAAKPARPASRVTPPIEKQTAEPLAEVPGAPAYLRYVRKETRLREDQQNQLTLQARRLNRAKKNQGARITENSLIRVAVDLMLAKVERASGDDEDAIWTSMST
jgi:hypothetical protein